MMKNVWTAFLTLALSFVFLSAAQAQSPQQTLNQYIADLQKNPNDYALREKIIRHVQTRKPAPQVPDEARRFMDRGMAAAEGAKTESDYRDAIQEFQKAVNSAPWLGSGYRNLAVVQDKAGQYAQAVLNLKLYLLTAPPAADAEAAKTLMDKIEYRQEKAAKESSPAAVAAKKQQTYEEWFRSLDGARYVGPSNVADTYFENELTIRGSTLFWRQRVTQYCRNCVQEVPVGQWYDMAQYGGRMQIVGREAKRILPGVGFVSDIFTISEDGKSITQVVQTTNVSTFTFYRH
jgi:tetratricopeptide (TPR) repeat protein